MTSAILEASTHTGASYEYLLATAQIESGLDPEARARTSSARGLFQFIESTWIASVQRHSERLSQLDSAQPDFSIAYLADPGLSRDAVLKMRHDPRLAAYMAAIDTKDNTRAMREALGRTPTHAELYLAHFLGRNGATRFAQVWKRNPHFSAARMFPAAARANRSIFYDKRGRARSLDGVRGVVASKLEGALEVVREREMGVWAEVFRSQNIVRNESLGVQVSQNFRALQSGSKSSVVLAGTRLESGPADLGQRKTVARGSELGIDSPVSRKSAYNQGHARSSSGSSQAVVKEILPAGLAGNSSLGLVKARQVDAVQGAAPEIGFAGSFDANPLPVPVVLAGREGASGPPFARPAS